MPIWLRLTHLFGLPDEGKDAGHSIAAALGPILRADADDLVAEPLPAEFVSLLCRLKQREQRARARHNTGAPQPRRLPTPTNDNSRPSDLPATGTE